MATKTPATVLTGFLGAGKTTLIRNLVTRAEGRRIALIINEFGDVGIDGALLRGCGAACADDDIVELANGCICCQVADDFLPTLTALLARGPFDHIVIETSGLALPLPLVRAFTWPEIRARVTVDGVVAVVDGPALLAGTFAPAGVDAGGHEIETPLSELFEDQLACADLVVVAKSDALAPGGIDAVGALLAEHLRPGTRVVASTPAGLAPQVLLGLGLAAEDDLDTRLGHHGAEGEDHDHGHDEFESFVLELPEIAAAAGVAERLGAAMAATGVLRLKGFAAVAGKPMRLVIQAVGPRVETWFDRPLGGARTTRLVVIGMAGLDRDAVRAAVAGALAAAVAA